MKKTYTQEFKAKILLEILKEEKAISQISSEYGVHPTQLNRWKTVGVKNLPKVFSDENKAADEARLAQERKENELYNEIGKLTTQLNWLKKKSGINIDT